MVPAGSGAYTASFTFQLGGLVKAGVTPLLPDGSVIVAGVVYQGASGTAGAPVLQLPIGQTTTVPPVYTPTGTALVTFSNVAVPSAVASAILANPAGFYFQLHSALNPAGVVRGQLIKQLAPRVRGNRGRAASAAGWHTPPDPDCSACRSPPLLLFEVRRDFHVRRGH